MYSPPNFIIMPYTDKEKEKARYLRRKSSGRANEAAKKYAKNNLEKVRKAKRLNRVRMLDKLRKFKIGKSCIRCGFNEHPCALDFHHREKSTKVFGVSQMGYCSEEKIMIEIEKCDLLCANCHRIVEYAEQT